MNILILQVEQTGPSVYVLLYMLGGMWLDFAAECAAPERLKG